MVLVNFLAILGCS